MNLDKLKKILDDDSIKINEPMKKHTTFKVGGEAKVLVTPKNIEEIKEIIKTLKEDNIPYYVIGKGSNLLVRDEGFNGVIVKISNQLSKVEVDDTKIYVEAGCSFIKLSKIAYENGLTGLEYAYGIPGTVGGAIAMNAGAYGGEVKDNILNATVLNENGEIVLLNKEELNLSYRKSIVSEKDIIVLDATFELKKANKETIKETMNNNNKLRAEKQPIDKRSAGSTFKRPKDNFAGKLIMDAGLSGYSVGGAMVSSKHCGFIVNENEATATDLLKLIEDVKKVVNDKFDIMLELEVKVI